MLQSRVRINPTGPTWVAGDEGEFFFFGAVVGPLEKMFNLGRFAVLVNTKDRRV